MQLTQDQTSSVQLVRAYGGGEVRINEGLYRGAVIVNADSVQAHTDVASVPALLALDLRVVLDFAPEVVLLGTGRRQVFPPPAYGTTFLSRGIGFEVMDTGAACRTYNVLVAEQRRVVGILLIE